MSMGRCLIEILFAFSGTLRRVSPVLSILGIYSELTDIMYMYVHT